jgi:hypothetical protein
LAALYAARNPTPRRPATDEVEMIDPPPALRISGIEYLMPRNTARSRVANVRSQSADETFSIGPSAPATPALLNVMSSRPYSLTARATAALISASLVTSVR